MKRPGPVGLTMLLAFGTVGVIEFRTVLAMLGIDVASVVYFPVAAVGVVAVIATLLVVGESGDGGGPSEGNPSEA